MDLCSRCRGCGRSGAENGAVGRGRNSQRPPALLPRSFLPPGDVYEVDFLMKGASERRGGGGGGGWGSQGELDTTGLAVQTQTGEAGLNHDRVEE